MTENLISTQSFVIVKVWTSWVRLIQNKQGSKSFYATSPIVAMLQISSIIKHSWNFQNDLHNIHMFNVNYNKVFCENQLWLVGQWPFPTHNYTGYNSISTQIPNFNMIITWDYTIGPNHLCLNYCTNFPPNQLLHRLLHNTLLLLTS